MASHEGDQVVAIERMMASHPIPPADYVSTLIDCVAACSACAHSCRVCADACLAERDAELGACIEHSLNCAEVCAATAAVLSRVSWTDSFVVRTLLLACAAAAAACAVECLKHDHEHCRLCAEACRACERACLDLTEEPLQ